MSVSASMTVVRIPCWAIFRARKSPTGPAPTIRTWVCGTSDIIGNCPRSTFEWRQMSSFRSGDQLRSRCGVDAKSTSKTANRLSRGAPENPTTAELNLQRGKQHNSKISNAGESLFD